jgi:hypothetical protein
MHLAGAALRFLPRRPAFSPERLASSGRDGLDVCSGCGSCHVCRRWIVRANQIGRILAMVIFGVLGLALLFPNFAEYLSRPFVRLGGRVGGQKAKASMGKSLLLGVSTGLLWTPCAGPILGLILTGAAIEGASVHTALLLVAFAAGAGCSLAVALLAGNKVFAVLGRGGMDSPRFGNCCPGGRGCHRFRMGHGRSATAFACKHLRY